MNPNSTDSASDPHLGSPRRYSAFISYSHRDSAWAKWLHTSLETFAVPRKFSQRPAVNQRTAKLKPVFRDREELPTAPCLRNAIRAALDDSEYLIVLCSPNAAASNYVNEEISYFCQYRDSSKVIALIVDGEPLASTGPTPERECFPRCFITSVDEPLAADARATGDGRHIAKLKVLSAILETSLGELRDRAAIRLRNLVVLRTLLVALATLTLTLLFVVASDAGIELPGSEYVRTLIDRNQVSILRPIGDSREVKAAAARANRWHVTSVLESQLNEGRFTWDVRGGQSHEDSWTTAQALAGLARYRNLSVAEGQQLLKGIGRMFESDVLKSVNGVPVGWEHRDGNSTMSPIAFWLVAALANAITRDDLFSPAEREKLRGYLEVTVGICETYRSSDIGGWLIFGGESRDNSSTYASALALQSLLEMHRANIPWQGSDSQRSQLISQTANWLASCYDSTQSVPGWRRKPDDHDATIFDGLTLQIYATLMQAESLGLVSLAPELVENAHQHINRCATRGFDSVINSGEFEGVVQIDGHRVEVNESVAFLWLPWTIQCAAQLLERNQRIALRPEQLTRIQRSYNHGILLTDSKLAKRDNRLFSIAETLYCLTGTEN